MRITLVTSSFPLARSDARAAAGLFVRDFALALHALGARVTVVTPDKTPGDKEPLPGVDVHWFPWRGGHKILGEMRPWRPADALAMASLFRQGARTLDHLAAGGGIDHLLALWAVPAGLLAHGLKERHGVPYTTWCLGSDIWTYARFPIVRGLVRRTLAASDHIYADGYELARAVTVLCGRPCPFLPSSRRLDPGLARDLDLPAARHRFLFVGRYHRVKGVDVLLDAFAAYRAAGGDGHLYLFGGGPLEGEVRSRAAGRDLAGSVTVGGFADEQTVVSYMSACDTVLIPSRMESIPVILSDALQLGRPVIVSDVGSMGRVVREAAAGLVVPPEDRSALASALAECGAARPGRFAPGIEQLASRFDVRRTAAAWLEHIASDRAG